ncbi:heparinase II/III domain-containing protein [Lederbergia galactosidilytica]|uniref:Uncharacterized protein n=2 Tax=Lederbergia galactosidilytica TaxID=217031 RepID=A0A177ZJX4_9BACI|nr:heparinase II/III family protein [Lederbergia galactosidilytica]OAK67883.1 hypothetical protein ABB05_17735 [Lederbergia galactosidilytica]
MYRKRKQIFLMIVFMCFLTVFLGGAGQASNSVMANTKEKGEVISSHLNKWGVIPKISQGPKIDGSLDDAVWKTINSLSGFVTIYHNESVEADTKVKFAYDEERLYIGLDYTSKDKVTSLVNFDVILSPSATGEQYFRIPLKVRNITPEYVNNWGPNLEIPQDIQTKIQSTDRNMTAEITVPLNSLGVEKVTSGDEWRFNAIVQHEMGTKPLSSWVPIRTSSIHYTGNNNATFYANVTDEDRLGSMYMGSLPNNERESDSPILWEPQQFSLKYKGITDKVLSFKRKDLNPKKTTIQLNWKSPSSRWQQIHDFQIDMEKELLKVAFQHPKPVENGLYQLQMVINREGKKTRYMIVSFDRHSLISAGETLFQTDKPTEGEKTKVSSEQPTEKVKKLLDIIPDKTGFRFAGLPDHPELHPDKLYKWNANKPDQLTSSYSDLTYPNEQYLEDQVITVTNKKGETIEYPYYEDKSGKRYFISAHLWYQRKDYVLGQLEKVAKEDPLGEARLLYRFAQVYEGYVPTNDYPWQTQPVDPNVGPPYHWWGGTWYRWAAAELSNFRPLVNAYEIVNKTNAFQVLSKEVGEDVEAKLIKDMFEPSIEFYRTFPVLSHNMEYQNALGLTTLGKALNSPNYIHEAVEWSENFVMNTYLFDGFFKETTLSYHDQSTEGINQVIDELEGWTDPKGYISPRLGERLINLDMREKYPALMNSKEISELLVYPNGKYFPTQDTWAFAKSTNPQLDSTSFLLPASGITRLARVSEENPAQLYLTFQPNYGHHHYDPLNLTLFAKGQELLPDIGYTHTFYRQWTNSTLAHNTVVVDSEDANTSGQAEHGGNIDVFAAENDQVQIMRANYDTAYSQTDEFSREPWFIQFPGAENNEGYVLDLFRVSGGDRHEYTLQGDANHDAEFETDISLRDYGPYLLPEDVEVHEPETEMDKGNAEGHYYGYIYVRDVKQADLTDGRYDVTLVTEEEGQTKANMKITGIVEPGENHLFLGKSPSLRATRLHGTTMDTNNQAVKYMMPKMVLRREGNDLTSHFVTAMEPYADGANPRIENIEKLAPDQASEGAIAVKVTYGDITDIIVSLPDSNQEFIVDDITLKGKMGMIRLKDGEVQDMYLVGGTSLKKGNVAITDEGPVNGTIMGVKRQAAGDSKNAFITEASVPDDALGNTIVITHPNGKTHGYRIKSVDIEDGNTVIEIDHMDPGFSMDEDGESKMEFFPFTKWIGATTFRIENLKQLND